MIDLHCHILPGVDDGPDQLCDSLLLADAASTAGTRIIAATPHLREDHPRVNVHEIAERCRELNRSIADAAIPVRVVPAAEVDMLWAREASDEELRLATYGQAGRDLLLESPSDVMPSGLEGFVANLTARGYRVLLAHPERSRGFIERPDRIAALVARGALLQVNAGALTRRRGSARSHALARDLVRRGLAHVIASDAHTASGRRPPDLDEALAEATKLRGVRALSLFTTTPRAILRGDELPDPAAAASGGAGRRPFRRRRAATAAS